MRQRLEDLGRLVAEQSDAASNPQLVLVDVQSRLGHRRPGLVARMARPALVAALVTAVSIAAFSFVSTKPGPITYEVSRVSEAHGGWIDTRSETVRLEFSEGTRVAVHPATRLRVSDRRENGATVVIERGRVVARVEHEKERRDWRFHAGPYLVQVTGTEFEVSWDASNSLFELALYEGSVVVSGPNLARDRVVRAGDVLRVSALAHQEAPIQEEARVQAELAVPEEPQRLGEGGRDASAEPDSADARSTAAAPRRDPTPSPARIPSAREAQSPEALDQKRPSDTDVQSPAWRKALAEGRRGDVVVELLREGGPSALEQARPGELWEIADAARVEGQPLLAQAALLRLREHHGARGRSAYLLGKIAIDQLGMPREAIKWFKTYLQEYPAGALSEQAWGRLVELGAGSSEGRAFAREYLKRFPRGAYVPFARSQLAP